MAYYGNAPADVALVVGQDVITTTEIQDSTIATADIANDAITALKIDDDGTGFQMGSLGLGTAVSGSEKLTVSGTASFSSDLQAGKFKAYTASTTDPVLILGDQGVADYNWTFPDTGTIKLSTNTSSTKKLFVKNDGSGEFGIETDGEITLPSYLNIDQTAQNGIRIKTDDTAVIWIYDKTSDAITGGVNWAHANGTTSFYTGGLTERFRITNEGRVQQLNTSIANSCFDILNTSSSGYGVHIQAGTGSNYSLVVKNKDNTEGFKVLGNGLVQCLRGFTNGQALDIEGETFGRTNSSNVAFGYRQDGNGQLMKIQKSSTDVFIMTNSGRIAQNISESEAYCATFENTSSGGYGLRVYGGASSADYLIRGHDHNGNDKFAVKSNGRIERPTHRDNQGTFVINPDGSANDNWVLTLTTLNYGFANIRIGAYGHSSYVNLDINLGGHMASGGTYYNANVITNESSSDIIVTLTQNQTGYIIKLSNNTSADQVYGHYQVIDGGYNSNATVTVENSNT